MSKTVVDYTYVQNTIWRIKEKYPCVRVNRIGKSVVGRSIYALELGRPCAPALLFMGTFIGQDNFTGELLLTWFASIAKAVTETSKIDGVAAEEFIRNHRIVVIPFVNPDGREICERGAHCAGVDCGRIKRLSGGNTKQWDANARGIDITQNFDFRFAIRKKICQSRNIYSPCGKGYTGTAPESEPETVAVVSYCRKHKMKQAVCLYPGKGRVFWRTPGVTGEEAEKQAHIIGVVADYEVEASVGCAVDTGFRNWFATNFRKPAFDLMVDSNHNLAHTKRLHEVLTLCCLF